VAVRADDIALPRLGKDAGDAGAAHEGRHPGGLRRGIAMVKIHRTLGEATAAVRARNGPELVQDVGVIAPPNSVILGPGLLGKSPGGEPCSMSAPTAQSMAVRANHVAFRGFLKQLLSALQGSAARTEIELLRARIAMVEVHLVPGQPRAAVSTRHFAKSSEERGRLVLASADPLDFRAAIRRVIPDVRRTLIAGFGHGQF